MVRGSMVLRPAGEQTAEALFAGCPQASIREPGGWVQRVLVTARRMLDGVPLSAMVERPTDALLDALSVLAGARQEVEAFERRLAAQAEGAR